MLRFGLALAAIEALVFAPVVALRSSRTLRELTLARDELDRLAHFDALTGLLNRRGFDKAAVGTLTTLGRPAAALMCDLDNFKGVNDRFGHEFGDVALRHVAHILRAAAGRDFAGLYGSRALANNALLRFEAAQSDVQQALRLSPRDPLAGAWRFQSCITQIGLGRFGVASDECQRVIAGGYRTQYSWAAQAAKAPCKSPPRRPRSSCVVGFLHSGMTGSADDLGCLRSAMRLAEKLTHLEQSFEPQDLRQTNDLGRADPALVGDSGSSAEDNIQRIFTGSRSKLRRGLSRRSGASQAKPRCGLGWRRQRGRPSGQLCPRPDRVARLVR